MRGLLREFRDFISAGNVVALAVAVVLGVAFGAVVASFTDDILMQLVAALGAQPSFEALAWTVRGTPIRYGAFLNAVIMFLIVAFVVFLVARAYNRLARPAAKATESELDVLRQIRDELRTAPPPARTTAVEAAPSAPEPH